MRITIKVVRGRLYVNHLAYNPDSGLWNKAPFGDQTARYELNQDDTKEIETDVSVVAGHRDRIEVVNPAAREEAWFIYEIENNPAYITQEE